MGPFYRKFGGLTVAAVRDNRVMRVRFAGRVAISVAFAALGCVLVGFAIFLLRQGLDRADQWSSVIAGFAGLMSLIASALSVLTGRGEPKPPVVPTVTTASVWGTYKLPL